MKFRGCNLLELDEYTVALNPVRLAAYDVLVSEDEGCEGDGSFGLSRHCSLSDANGIILLVTDLLNVSACEYLMPWRL